MSLPSSAIPFIPGDIVDGKYRVEEVLGAGGMGVVLAARHLTLDSDVAVKVLLPKFQKDPVIRERFLREARAAATLRSSHVTKIYDVGVDRLDAPYIVMERLRGKDLEQMVNETGPLDERMAMDFVHQACEALAEAHAAGIVHRDLKPENLFVSRIGGVVVVKVLDFGISKASYEEKKLTATSDVMGTPSFMSPEQFKSAKDVSPRSDVWALGAILYRILTGGLPFDGKDYVELCSRIMTQAPDPIELRRPDLSPALAAIVRRCLEKDPMQRFANAYELKDALRTTLTASKANHRLAMAATLPFDQAPPDLAAALAAKGITQGYVPPAPRIGTPWPSQGSSSSSIVIPKRSYRRFFLFAAAAALCGVFAYGATHRAQVTQATNFVHPAPMLAEAPVVVSTESVEAPASMLAMKMEEPKAPIATAKRAARPKAKRGSL